MARHADELCCSYTRGVTALANTGRSRLDAVFPIHHIECADVGAQTYQEPIAARVRFNNHNCLNCRQGTPKFEALQSHHTADERLASNQMICLNCHGQAHPISLQRTPGSVDYARLMEPVP